MKFGIIISKEIEKRYGFSLKPILIKEKIIFAEIEKAAHSLDDAYLKKMNADYFIVLSIHSLADKPKRLSVHPCGNWNDLWVLGNGISLGGIKKTLSKSSGAFLKFAYLSLLKNNNLKDYIVSIECTHHGPAVNKPILFLEIGCSEKEFKDDNAKKVVVNVVKDIMNNFSESKKKSCVVLGGDHYMRNISDLLFNTNLQVSHMCPSSNIAFFDGSMLKEAINKTQEEIDFFIIDLAGVGQHRAKIENILEKNKIDFRYLHEIK